MSPKGLCLYKGLTSRDFGFGASTILDKTLGGNWNPRQNRGGVGPWDSAVQAKTLLADALQLPSRPCVMPPPRCPCGAARTPLATAALRSSWEDALGLKWSWVTPSGAYWHMCLACHQTRWPGDGRVRNRYCRPRSSDPRCRVGARACLAVGELYLTEPPPELRSAAAPLLAAAESDSSDESVSRSRSFFRLPPPPPRSPRLRPHVPPPQGWPFGIPLGLIAEPCDGWSCAFCTEMRELRHIRHMRGLRVPSLRSSTRNPEHVSVPRLVWMVDDERMAFDGRHAVCLLGTSMG